MFKKDIENIIPYKLKDTLELNIEDYINLTKEECIKKIMKNPKKMLINIYQNINSDIKSNITKKYLAEELYKILQKS